MKKFMTSFTVLAASFAAQHADAQLAQQKTPLVTPSVEASMSGQVASSKITMTDKTGDTFGFTLERTGSGQLMAYHESHASHASHSSHSSHYSSRY